MGWSRRSLLRGGAAAVMAAPFLRLLDGRAVAAEGDASRLLVFFTPNGTVPNKWLPVGDGPGYSFAPGSILEPLSARTSDLLVISGLDFHRADNHEPGMAAMLTNNGAAGDVGGGASIDQYIAAAIGDDTKFRSLEIGVQTSAWGGNQQTRMCYAGPGQFVTPDDSPLSVYQRMYGDLLQDPEEAARLLTRRQSILDAATEDLEDLHRRLGAQERIKLDAHLEALRQMEQSLSSSGLCEPGVEPALGGTYDNDSYPDLATAQLDLAVEALACELTRVVSVQMSHTVGGPVMTWEGLSDAHHALSHMADSDPAGVADFVTAERWYASQFGALLDRLEARADPGGDGTLLDHTVVIWVKEMGDGRLHVCEGVPFVLAGGTGTHYTLGRHLQASGNHMALLVSLLQMFGLTDTTYGDATAGSGPLGGLL